MNFVVTEREQSAAFEGASVVGTVRCKLRQFGASGWHRAHRALRVLFSAKSRSTSHVELLRRARVSYNRSGSCCFLLFFSLSSCPLELDSFHCQSAHIGMKIDAI